MAEKQVIYNRETGQRLERWSIDARAMLDSGQFSSEPVTGKTAAPAPLAIVPADRRPLPRGYTISEAGKPPWFKLHDPEGKQVGAAKRKWEDAFALLPATLIPGAAPGGPDGVKEHSVGVPLIVGEAGAAQPLQLP